ERARDGRMPARLEAAFPAEWLREGDNQLDLENVGDTVALNSMVFLDRFDLRYPRQAAAVGGVLDGRFASAGTATVAGLAVGSAVVDTTSAVPLWLRGAVATRSGLAFRAEADHRYLTVAAAALLPPQRLS